MTNPTNNLLTFTPGTIIQSAQVNQNFNDTVQLAGNSVGSQLQTLLSQNFNQFIQSGGVMTTASGLTVNMSAAYIVVAGITYYMPAQSFTVTASRDTYIDFVPGTVPAYQPTLVTNNSSSPALYATNAVRMGIIVSGSSAINFINQGQTDCTLSNFSPVIASLGLTSFDSNGVPIYPQTPFPTNIGYREYNGNPGNANSSSYSAFNTNLTLPFIVPVGGRKCEFTFDATSAQISSSPGAFGILMLIDGNPFRQKYINTTSSTTNYNNNLTMKHKKWLAGGSHTLTIYGSVGGSYTLTLEGGNETSNQFSATPMGMSVDIV